MVKLNKNYTLINSESKVMMAFKAVGILWSIESVRCTDIYSNPAKRYMVLINSYPT